MQSFTNLHFISCSKHVPPTSPSLSQERLLWIRVTPKRKDSEKLLVRRWLTVYCGSAMYTGLGLINVLQTGSIAVSQSITENLQLCYCNVGNICQDQERCTEVFDALQGSLPLSSLNHLKLHLSDEHFIMVEIECNWSGAKAWVQWWTRNRHLQMLAKPFIIMNSDDWDGAPQNTNGVE